MINEELCNLIWNQYNKYPSSHLYALWIAYKECGEYIGLCLFRGSEKIADIGDDIFWETYYAAEKRYRYYNEKILEIINKRKNDI